MIKTSLTVLPTLGLVYFMKIKFLDITSDVL